MVCGIWYMVYGIWCMVHIACYIDLRILQQPKVSGIPSSNGPWNQNDGALCKFGLLGPAIPTRDLKIASNFCYLKS